MNWVFIGTRSYVEHFSIITAYVTI